MSCSVPNGGRSVDRTCILDGSAVAYLHVNEPHGHVAAMYKQMGWKLGFFTLADGCAEYCNVSNEKVKLF